MTTQDPRLWTQGYRRLRQLVLDRDRHLCQVRGRDCSRFATEVDHVIPRADGGDVFDPRNLRASCRSCNSQRAADRTNRRWRRPREVVSEYQDVRL